MVRSFKNLKQAIRDLPRSDWENCVPLRWLAQMAVGIVPGVVILALLIKSAHDPLPPLPGDSSSTNLASIIPIFAASSVAESPSFHRLVAQKHIAASEEVQFRRSSHLHQAIPVHSAAAVAEPLLQHDFNASRAAWTQLEKADRHAVDELVAGNAAATLEVVIHGGRHFETSPRLLGRYLQDVRGAAEGACDIIISERGIEVMATASASGPLDIVMAGDFHQSPPTAAQLEALDELLDYLSIKADRVQLMQHVPDANVVAESCLGRHFPIRQIIAAINPSEG